MLPDFYSYTAVFSHEADGWIVDFPDLERCSTNADSLDEAIVQAHNILEDYMAILERNNMPVPPSTPHEDIKTPLEGSKQRIVVSMREARIRWANKTVRKTVTLPAWIVQKANFQGLNLSKILLDSLKRKLKATVPAGM